MVAWQVIGKVNGTDELLSNVASIQRGTGLGAVSHYNITPVLDIYGAVHAPRSRHLSQQPGAQQPTGFVARINALMNLPSTWGAIASTINPLTA